MWVWPKGAYDGDPPMFRAGKPMGDGLHSRLTVAKYVDIVCKRLFTHFAFDANVPKQLRAIFHSVLSPPQNGTFPNTMFRSSFAMTFPQMGAWCHACTVNSTERLTRRGNCASPGWSKAVASPVVANCIA